MKILFFLLCLFISIQAQSIYSTTFSSFVPDSTNSHLISWYGLKDGAGWGGKLKDAAGSDDLTANGAGLGDSTLTTKNVIKEGLDVIYFDSSVPQYFTGGVTGFNSNSGTVFVVSGNSRFPAGGNDLAISVFVNTSNSVEVYKGSSVSNYLRYRAGGTNEIYSYSAFDKIGEMHVYAVNWSVAGTVTDTAEQWVDGALAQGNNSLGSWAGSPTLGIGAQPSGGIPYFGFIDFVAIYDTMLTAKQMQELCFLAEGWVSNSGGVTRETLDSTFAFAQGIITDTVYCDSVLSAENWNVSIDIKGNSGGETYQILTSPDAVTWTALKSGSAPGNLTTINFTGIGLGYIGLSVSSAADTVYFDNINIQSGNIYSNSFTGFPEFSTFENDEVIQ